MDYKEDEPEYIEALKNKNTKKYFMSIEEMKDDGINKE